MLSVSMRIMIVAAMLSFALSSSAWAGAPTDQLRNSMDQIFKILMEPGLAGVANGPQRSAAVARIAGDIFDFGEMSKRTLGQHWEQRTPAERDDFSRLFTELIQRTYFRSKVDEHGSEKTIFGTETVDGNHAVVRTTLLLAHGTKMPLDYAMLKTGERWCVYDLSIDGISLVASYRSQFNRIIRTASYAELVTRMRSQQADFAGPSASSPGPTSAR